MCAAAQGYGLTETSAATCIQLLTDNSTSVVGPPQESACIRLRDWEEGGYYNSDLNKEGVRARRGEVLIGGPSIATAYLVDSKKPDPEVVKKNEEDFVDIDGIRYFCTGDIGEHAPRRDRLAPPPSPNAPARSQASTRSSVTSRSSTGRRTWSSCSRASTSRSRRSRTCSRPRSMPRCRRDAPWIESRYV